jgi:hypothetical protein
MSSILLRPSCPPEDDPDIRRLLELVAAASGASFVELELAAPDGETRRYRRGKPIAESSSHPLSCGTIGRLTRQRRSPARPAPELAAFALTEFSSACTSAQLSALLAGMETSTSGVLFDHGEVAHANPRAKVAGRS